MTQFFNYLASAEEIESSRADINEKLTREKNQKNYRYNEEKAHHCKGDNGYG